MSLEIISMYIWPEFVGDLGGEFQTNVVLDPEVVYLFLQSPVFVPQAAICTSWLHHVGTWQNRSYGLVWQDVSGWGPLRSAHSTWSKHIYIIRGEWVKHVYHIWGMKQMSLEIISMLNRSQMYIPNTINVQRLCISHLALLWPTMVIGRVKYGFIHADYFQWHLLHSSYMIYMFTSLNIYLFSLIQIHLAKPIHNSGSARCQRD